MFGYNEGKISFLASEFPCTNVYPPALDVVAHVLVIVLINIEYLRFRPIFILSGGFSINEPSLKSLNAIFSATYYPKPKG